MKKLYALIIIAIVAVMYFTNAFSMGLPLYYDADHQHPKLIAVHVVVFNQKGGRLPSRDAFYSGFLRESDDKNIGSVEVAEFIGQANDAMINLVYQQVRGRGVSYEEGKYTVVIPAGNGRYYTFEDGVVDRNRAWVDVSVYDDVKIVDQHLKRPSGEVPIVKEVAPVDPTNSDDTPALMSITNEYVKRR